MARDFYAEANHKDDEVHPVDAAIERRLPHRSLRRRLRAATDALMTALGPRRKLWFPVEQLKSRYHAEREEEYYRLGYEHGATAGRAEALSARTPRGTRAQRDLASWVRDITVEAHLPLHLKVATLLETAWALVLGHEPAAPRVTVRGKRMRRSS